MSEKPKVRIALEVVVEFDADAWDHLYNGGHPLTPGNALGHLMDFFEADSRGTGVTSVASMEATDPETGEPVDES